MTYLLTQYRRKLGEVFFGITDHEAEEVSIGSTLTAAAFTFIGGPSAAGLAVISCLI